MTSAFHEQTQTGPAIPPWHSGPIIVDAYDLLQRPAPPREWHVNPWIPGKDVSLLGGDGGTGKTLLALQLAIASAYGWTWLDLPVTQCPTVFFCAEESVNELHHRLEKIATPLISIRPLPKRLRLISTAHTDSELVTFEAGKPMKAGVLLDIEDAIREMRAGLLIIDAQADAFDGDEIDRRQVRGFVRDRKSVV